LKYFKRCPNIRFVIIGSGPEEENIKKLEKIVSDWDFAQKIRVFADTLEMKAALVSDKNEQKQIKEWTKWVRSKADWLDPLIDREDELLGKHPHILDILKQFDS